MKDFATLSSALTKARKLRLITHNPCVDVGKLNERRERRQAKPLTYDEEARVRQFSRPWLSILITVLAETGLRVRKEALPLKWSDVDLESEPGCIRVRDSKTAAGVRPVWLTKHCRNTLIQWREFLGPGFSEYVFPSPRIPSRTSPTTRKRGRKQLVRQEFQTDESTTFAHHSHRGPTHATPQGSQSLNCLVMQTVLRFCRPM